MLTATFLTGGAGVAQRFNEGAEGARQRDVLRTAGSRPHGQPRP